MSVEDGQTWPADARRGQGRSVRRKAGLEAQGANGQEKRYKRI